MIGLPRWRLAPAILAVAVALGASLLRPGRMAQRPARAGRITAHSLPLDGREAPPQSARGRMSSRLAPPPARDDARVEIGRAAFFDPALSEPEGTSCASCHDPRQGYAGNHGSNIGVARGSRPDRYARRNTPSVMYLRFVRRFHLTWDEEDADHAEPSGGFFWDGRADSIAELITQPLLNANEMGNRDLRHIAEKLSRAAYAAELRREFDDAFASPERALSALGLCLEAFLTSREMSPFTSKYDDFVRGEVELSSIERRGLRLFEDAEKGACSGCHRADRSSGAPEGSLFSDYGYDAIAVPRNRKLPRNREGRFDLGLCERRDRKRHTEDEWYCGSFRTPSLRNVALRTSYMHNGVFSSLREVVEFYATRATNPERWYGKGTFDDLPARYHEYVNTISPPYNQPRGDAPRLDSNDVDAIVAFLDTLTDRRIPARP